MKLDIRFIASAANVSPATVSRVINGTKPVSDELRIRVWETIKKYHYRTDSFSSVKTVKGAKVIGVIAPNVSSYFHAKLISAIEKIAADNQYSVIVKNAIADECPTIDCFRMLLSLNVDGIILMDEVSPETLAEIHSLSLVPTILASISVPGTEFPKVGIDDRTAAYDAVSCLLRLGHRQIGAIFNDCYSLNVLRREGFEDALREYGIASNEKWVRIGACSIEQGEALAAQIFSGNDSPTALFCVSDEQAVGVQNYLMDHGYHIPEDISIVGFDDVELGSVVRPKLTTVHQPITEIGTIAAEKLIKWIETGIRPSGELLPHMMIMRASTRRI